MPALNVDRSTNINDLFSHFFVVADFQRDYVWDDGDVSNLLDDIASACATNPNRQYFIGAVVLAPGPSDGFQVIDGQQRLLTIFVAMAALRHRMTEISPDAPEIEILTQKLLAYQLTASETAQRLRIIPSFDSGAAALDSILRDAQPGEAGEAIEHLWDAYTVAKGHYQERANTIDEARRIAAFLLNQVALLPYVAVDQQQALTVFETLNSRGQRLSALDLVKSIAFANSPTSEWETLKADWATLADSLEKTREAPKRLLRYYLLVELGERVDENGVYDWIRGHQSEVSLRPDPRQFVASLSSFVLAYSHVKRGALPDGRAHHVCKNIRTLTGSGRQYFPTVLALRHLTSAPALDRALLAIESFIVAYAVQRRYTGRIESTFASWALAMRVMKRDEELATFLETTIEPAVQLAGRDALVVLRALEEGALAKAKVTYLLERLDSHLQIIANGAGVAYRDVANYSGFDIEHIFPVSKASTLTTPSALRRLGNLTLLEKPLNRAVKDKEFAEKSSFAYENSQYLLTKAMVTSLPGGSSTARAFSLVETFTSWGELEIAKRHENLVELSCGAFGWTYEPPT